MPQGSRSLIWKLFFLPRHADSRGLRQDVLFYQLEIDVLGRSVCAEGRTAQEAEEIEPGNRKRHTKEPLFFGREALYFC